MHCSTPVFELSWYLSGFYLGISFGGEAKSHEVLFPVHVTVCKILLTT
jgi:hypothetical protein